jgi:hypothetical protein
MAKNGRKMIEGKIMKNDAKKHDSARHDSADASLVPACPD